MTGKKLTGIDKMRNRKELVEVIGFSVAILAGFVLIAMAMQMGTWHTLLDKKYLTDPDLPISEWQNATFTVTHDQINHEIMEEVYYCIVAGAIAAIGLGFGWAGLLTPTNEELHKMGCKTGRDVNYCPECGVPNKYCSECGLKLSRLKAKKKKE